MCYNFIAYYPEEAWNYCLGFPSETYPSVGTAVCDDSIGVVTSWNNVQE
jgi:hypothetical protein